LHHHNYTLSDPVNAYLGRLANFGGILYAPGPGSTERFIGLLLFSDPKLKKKKLTKGKNMIKYPHLGPRPLLVFISYDPGPGEPSERYKSSLFEVPILEIIK